MVFPGPAARLLICGRTGVNSHIRPAVSWNNNEQAPVCIARARCPWHPSRTAFPATLCHCFGTSRMLARKKNAPGKVASQGGRGHVTFPGAIGRVKIDLIWHRFWQAGPGADSGLIANVAEAHRVGFHAGGIAPRGPQERPAKSIPRADPSTWFLVFCFWYSRNRPGFGRCNS